MVCFDKKEIILKTLTLESKGFYFERGRGMCHHSLSSEFVSYSLLYYFNQLLKVLSIPSPRVALKIDKSIQFIDFHNIITDFLS